MNSDSMHNMYSSPEVREEWQSETEYRGINFGYSWDYQRDMFAVHRLDVSRMLKECIDLFIDHGVTHRLIHPLDLFTHPVMLLQWEVHGDKLITKMSRA
jgi:hypothetical protein